MKKVQIQKRKTFLRMNQVIVVHTNLNIVITY